LGTSSREAVTGSLRTLFTAGALSGLTDGQLLERFQSRSAAAEAAFTLLVERHGPMVLGVCRDILGDAHDAEDAFQATFLVLVRRANSIHKGESVPSWLFGVARRVALRARARRLSIRRGEAVAFAARPVTAMPPGDHLPELYEELDRLPERFRAVIVLCDLEGQTYEQAASLLECTLGTVQSRLARGRARLRHRLMRRGLSPMLVGPVLTPTAVPPLWREATVRAAIRIAVTGGTTGAVPAVVAELVEGVVRTMIWGKSIKLAGGIALVACALALAIPVGAGSGPEGRDQADEVEIAKRPQATAKTPRAVDAGTPQADERIAPLLGTWKRVSAEGQDLEGDGTVIIIKQVRDGSKFAEALGFEAPFVCTLAYANREGHASKPGTLILADPGPDPKRLTLLPVGAHPGDADAPDGFPGIYRVEGDTLTIHSTIMGERPSNFERSENRTASLEFYRRVAQDPPARDD
jgi:RNA polymerase sigma-70 factor (ECF subfamily)